MGNINKEWQHLKNAPMQTLANWQTMRWWWLTSACIALMMNLIAHNFFQGFLEMDPCEKCVYIRYAMFCIVIGGVVATINPKQLILRVFGYVFTLYGAIFGAIWSKELIDSYYLMKQLEIGGDPFAAGIGGAACSTDPNFHFGLPLDHWFPSWFSPTGVCGADDWSFLGLDMGSWTFIIFSVYLVLIALSFIALAITATKRKK